MISTVDLLVFTGSDKLLLYNKNILRIYKTSYPEEEVNYTCLSRSISIPRWYYNDTQ